MARQPSEPAVEAPDRHREPHQRPSRLRPARARGAGVDATHTVDDCSGKPTYFAMETGFRYTESLGAGAPAPRDLFTAFVKAAESKFGCAKS
ncbi:hypothetical protein GCM10017750_06120 [Streptomyces racemochromogenes]